MELQQITELSVEKVQNFYIFCIRWNFLMYAGRISTYTYTSKVPLFPPLLCGEFWIEPNAIILSKKNTRTDAHTALNTGYKEVMKKFVGFQKSRTEREKHTPIQHYNLWLKGLIKRSLTFPGFIRGHGYLEKSCSSKTSLKVMEINEHWKKSWKVMKLC